MNAQLEPDPKPRLTIELVPTSSWGANLSSGLNRRDWDVVRKETYRRAGHRCERCGGRGAHHPVEAHEVWQYDDAAGIQRLVRLVALCPACHEVCHFGRATAHGREEQALAHLAAVNGWTVDQARRHASEAIQTWQRRRGQTWKIDLSILADYGITPPTDSELEASANRTRTAIQDSAARRRTAR